MSMSVVKMRTQVFASVWVLLVIAALIEVAQGYKCTYTAPNGDYFDYSPLTKCDHTGYVVHTADDYDFNINICLEVTGCDGGAAVCQANSWDAGKASSAAFVPAANNAAILKYTDGDKDPVCTGGERSTLISFTCDHNAATPVFTFGGETPKCTYNFNIRSKYACPVSKGPQVQTCPFNVFLVPHTHDDVGWIVSIDEYYRTEVRSIISTAVQSLMANPDRHFVYVEQAFFTRWWYDTTVPAQEKADLKSLVAAGRWEFLIGGWTMQDEACTTYGANVNQMTQGHQFLLDTFGARPTRGWQLDPFGAGPVTPFLQKLAGFESHLIDRISDKDSYSDNQRLQFVWQTEPSLGQKSELFTEILGGSSAAYCDWLSSFPFDGKVVSPANVSTWGELFLRIVAQRRPWYKTNNMLAMWGCDFQFQDANKMFASMDLVVAWLKTQEQSTGIYVRYSNASAYFDSVQASAAANNVEWQVNEGGDFFPYLGYGLYWSGYFTSRTQLKGIVRKGEGISQALEPWHPIGRALYKGVNTSNTFNALNSLRVANADATHHDGVSGTSNPDVVLMYGNDINAGINNAKEVTAPLLSKFASAASTPALSPNTTHLTKIQSGQTVAVVLTNSLGWSRTSVVNFETNFAGVVVTDSQGKAVTSQVTTNKVSNNPTSKYVLYFLATVPALGFNTYFVSATGASDMKEEYSSSADQTIANSILSVTISNNLISSVTNVVSKVVLPATQQIKEYTSKRSGAYAFAPAGDARSFGTPSIKVSTGPLVTEVAQNFSGYAKQVIRIYHAAGNADVEGFIETWTELGPLPSHKELVSAWNTSIVSNGVFYTDANGLQFLARTIQSDTGIEGNYYPMVYASYIKDDVAQLSLIAERTHGTASLQWGQLEAMVHRNPDMGDGFGPGLTDTTVVYPVLRTLVDTPEKSYAQVYKQSYLLNFPLVAFTAEATTAKDYVGKFATSNQILKEDLPANVHLLSLNSLDASSNKAVLRFTHLFAIGEDPQLSKPVTVDVSKIFKGVNIKSFAETTLTANKVLNGQASTQVLLNPKDIRTFVVTFSL